MNTHKSGYLIGWGKKNKRKNIDVVTQLSATLGMFLLGWMCMMVVGSLSAGSNKKGIEL